MGDDAKPQGRVIDLDISIEAPVDQVWEALTTSRGLASWFAESAEAQTGLEAPVSLSWGKDMTWTTHIKAFEPEKHLRWSDPPYEEGGLPMAVDFFLHAEGGQVRLRLVHSGFGEDENWDEQYDGTEAGWLFFLYNLNHYLRYHPGVQRTMIRAREAMTGTREQIWNRIVQQGAGLVEKGPDLIEAGSVLELAIGPENAVEAVLDIMIRNRTLGFRVPDLNNALLHIEIEPGSKDCSVGMWLSTYGLEKLTETEKAFRKAVGALYKQNSTS